MVELAIADQALIENDDFAARFWGKAALAENGCLLWTGAVKNSGYPSVKIKGSWFYAHRVAYAISHGNFAKCSVVMHSCDNRRCINPSHLTLGTLADNARDMVEKGRGSRSGGGSARLSETEVRRLKRLYAEGASINQLSRMFGLSRTSIKWRLVRTPARFSAKRHSMQMEQSR